MRYLIFVSVLFVLSCSSNPDTPDAWAKKFCSCSDGLGKAIVKLRAEEISQKEFEAVKMEQEKCMGPTDPRQSMSPEEVEAFDAAFMNAIFKHCPNVARDYGFNK